ncbi:hypothetical protein ACIRQY_17350 [Streptomyces sp. NPDC101490]|uniref:hypothetical protein n=1 Tax=Streptomyces sp. NPDC101490 TaxID=3366143 RepID=UPI0037FF4CC3
MSLDRGGPSLAETALSVLGEPVASDNGRGGHRLRDGRLPIRSVRAPAPAAPSGAGA